MDSEFSDGVLYNKSHAKPRYKMIVNLRVNMPKTKCIIEILNFENCNMFGYIVKIWIKIEYQCIFLFIFY